MTSPLSRNSTALTGVTSSIRVSVKPHGHTVPVFGVKRNGCYLKSMMMILLVL
jgi:hypothetical protein